MQHPIYTNISIFTCGWQAPSLLRAGSEDVPMRARQPAKWLSTFAALLLGLSAQSAMAQQAETRSRQSAQPPRSSPPPTTRQQTIQRQSSPRQHHPQRRIQRPTVRQQPRRQQFQQMKPEQQRKVLKAYRYYQSLPNDRRHELRKQWQRQSEHKQDDDH